MEQYISIGVAKRHFSEEDIAKVELPQLVLG